jgi:dihydrofolate reductase
MPKYVVSSTIEHPAWNNSTVLNGDVVHEVSKLKRELDGDIVVYGSRQLVRTLMEHDLVDELRLTCASATPRPWVTASLTSPTRSGASSGG